MSFEIIEKYFLGTLQRMEDSKPLINCRDSIRESFEFLFRLAHHYFKVRFFAPTLTLIVNRVIGNPWTCRGIANIFNLGGLITCLYISYNSYIYVYVCVRQIELKEIKKWSLKTMNATKKKNYQFKQHNKLVTTFTFEHTQTQCTFVFLKINK